MKALLVGMLLASTLVTALPVASAAPDYECMDYYNQTDLGVVVITQRSSCDAEVCVRSADNDCGGTPWW